MVQLLGRLCVAVRVSSLRQAVRVAAAPVAAAAHQAQDVLAHVAPQLVTHHVVLLQWQQQHRPHRARPCQTVDDYDSVMRFGGLRKCDL